MLHRDHTATFIVDFLCNWVVLPFRKGASMTYLFTYIDFVVFYRSLT